MSHSQFHSAESFTLRHAWLNLWDKHMTTGRINQIAIYSVTSALWKALHTDEENERARAHAHNARIDAPLASVAQLQSP